MQSKKSQKFGATLSVGATGVHARRGLGWCVCPLGISNVVRLQAIGEPRPVLYVLIEGTPVWRERKEERKSKRERKCLQLLGNLEEREGARPLRVTQAENFGKGQVHHLYPRLGSFGQL